MATRPAQLEAEENLDETFDASDPKQVNNARKKQSRERRAERELTEALMKHVDGRLYLYNSVKCVIEGNPVVPGDIHSTYFNLGQETVARNLFKELLKIDPQGVVDMIKENLEN